MTTPTRSLALVSGASSGIGPDGAKAAMHRKMAEPGTGDDG
jgi:NADP-dependent 3-hydroxy acid dehydrogenase YdfG